MTILIFDIDGTLIDSTGLDSKLYRQAVQEVLGSVQFRSDWSEYTDVTDPGILRQILREKGVEHPSVAEPIAAARARFGELVADRLAEEPCRPLPGAVGAMARLIRDPKVRVGLATGGWGHTAAMKLRSAGFPTESIPIFTADHHHQRIGIMRACLSSLAPGETEASPKVTYIGDGPWDLKASSELDWGFVAVGPRLQGKWRRWIPHFADPSWSEVLGLTVSG